MLVDSRPRFAEFKSDGSEVWVSAEIGGTVSVIDTATHEIKHKITFEIAGLRPEAIQPVGVRITKDGKTAFVALGPANRVAVVNAETYEVEDYLLVGQRVWQLAFSPDESLIFSTNGVSNDVSVIDVANREVTKSIQVGRLPWGVVTTPRVERDALADRSAKIRKGRKNMCNDRAGTSCLWPRLPAMTRGRARRMAQSGPAHARRSISSRSTLSRRRAARRGALRAGVGQALPASTSTPTARRSWRSAAPSFFRNVWINEIVINDIEVRPLGVDSIEFDAAGEAEITFVTIRPGTFTLRIPGTTGEAQAATFNVNDPMFAPGAVRRMPRNGVRGRRGELTPLRRRLAL